MQVDDPVKRVIDMVLVLRSFEQQNVLIVLERDFERISGGQMSHFVFIFHSLFALP